MEITPVEQEKSLGSQPSVIKLLECLIAYAKEIDASDIFLDSTPQEILVKIVMDDAFQGTLELPINIKINIISGKPLS